MYKRAGTRVCQRIISSSTTKFAMTIISDRHSLCGGLFDWWILHNHQPVMWNGCSIKSEHFMPIFQIIPTTIWQSSRNPFYVCICLITYSVYIQERRPCRANGRTCKYVSPKSFQRYIYIYNSNILLNVFRNILCDATNFRYNYQFRQYDKYRMSQICLINLLIG